MLAFLFCSEVIAREKAMGSDVELGGVCGELGRISEQTMATRQGADS